MAEAIGRTPEEIWPSRFNEDGTRKSIKRMSTIRREALKQSSQNAADCHVNERKAA